MNDRELQAFAQRVLGQRFSTDFTVVGIGPGPQATLQMYGEQYRIGLDELHTVVQRGLVVEMPALGGGPVQPRQDTH